MKRRDWIWVALFAVASALFVYGLVEDNRTAHLIAAVLFTGQAVERFLNWRGGYR